MKNTELIESTVNIVVGHLINKVGYITECKNDLKLNKKSYNETTIEFRSNTLYKMSHMEATDTLDALTGYYEEVLKEQYPQIRLDYTVGEKGYCSITVWYETTQDNVKAAVDNKKEVMVEYIGIDTNKKPTANVTLMFRNVNTREVYYWTTRMTCSNNGLDRKYSGEVGKIITKCRLGTKITISFTEMDRGKIKNVKMK